ncbi:MAG: SLATT domain-containing protein [Desemzia incerta]
MKDSVFGENKIQYQQHTEIKRFFVNVSWTHKIQIKQSDIYLQKKNCLNKIKIVTSALISSGILAIIFVDEKIINVVTACISFISLTINALDKTSDYEQMYLKTKRDSDALWELREKTLALLYAVSYNTLSEEKIMQEFTILFNERKKLYSQLLTASPEAVNQASDAIYKSKDNNYREEEEHLIPEELLSIKEQRNDVK